MQSVNRNDPAPPDAEARVGTIDDLRALFAADAARGGDDRRELAKLFARIAAAGARVEVCVGDAHDVCLWVRVAARFSRSASAVRFRAAMIDHGFWCEPDARGERWEWQGEFLFDGEEAAHAWADALATTNHDAFRIVRPWGVKEDAGAWWTRESRGLDFLLRYLGAATGQRMPRAMRVLAEAAFALGGAFCVRADLDGVEDQDRACYRVWIVDDRRRGAALRAWLVCAGHVEDDETPNVG